MKSNKVLAVAASLMLGGVLVSCAAGDGTDDGNGSGNNSGDASSCTNTIKNEDAPLVTLWAWYPNRRTPARAATRTTSSRPPSRRAAALPT